MTRSISRRYADKLGTAITPAIHKRGYDLFRSGLQEKRCRAELGLTATQWRWLRSEGNSQFESYESLMIREVEAIRTQAREAAIELSGEGVAAMRLRVQNATAANAITQLILQTSVEEMRSRIARGDVASLHTSLPSKSSLSALKVLQRIGELGPTAEAFTKIYGDVAGHKAIYPDRDRPRSAADSGEPLRELQGKQSERDSFMTDEAMTEVIDDLRGMSVEDLREFVEGGDEPVADTQPGEEL